MRTAGWQAWRRRLDPVADPALAALVLALHADAMVVPEQCGCASPGALGWVLVLAAALPLAFRRRHPFATSLLAGLATAAYGLTELSDPLIPYAGLVGLHTVAAHGTRLQSRVAITVCAVLIPLIVWVDGGDSQDLLVNSLLFATAWLLGDGARTRRERAAELEARAEQLERTRQAEAQAAVVAERNRIAREMHDVVAHHVSMMVVQAESGPVALRSDPARAEQAFDDISAAGKRALTELRRVLGALRDGSATPSLAPAPDLGRVQDLVDGVRATGREVRLSVAGALDALPPSVALSAYRVLQEALTNVVKHAGPAPVAVRVDAGPDRLRLEVLDEGRAPAAEPSPAVPGSGQGLVAMRERVGLLGGTLAVGPRPDGGWGVVAELPLAVAGTPA